jgi:uncharacterized protein
MHLTDSLYLALQEEVRSRMSNEDPSHDFSHIERVTNSAYMIAVKEGADTDIVLPAALFHDIVTYQKDDQRSAQSSSESADLAKLILYAYRSYQEDKVDAVGVCIAECSFSKGIMPQTIEGKVLQDADLLEATGMIAIMRTFASCGQMRRRFYDQSDPFCERRQPDAYTSGLDLFYKRLLLVPKRLHTSTAKAMATRRHRFLKSALKELRLELEETNVL